MSNVHTRAYQQLLRLLRCAREDAGLTQTQVARKLNRPQSFVSKCESGERRIDVIELRDFLMLYGQRVGEFVDQLPGGPPQRRH